MDSRAYYHFVEKYHRDNPLGTSAEWTDTFARKPDQYALFLRQAPFYTAKALDCAEYHILSPNTTIGDLFRECFVAVMSKLSGGESNYKSVCTTLLSFQTALLNPRESLQKPESCPRCTALLCFLAEAQMYLGWCGNAVERQSKWLAHQYFAMMKKQLSAMNGFEHEECAFWIWGAWIYAQTTEGIRETPPVRQDSFLGYFKWGIPHLPSSTLLFHQPKPSARFYYHLTAENPSHPHHDLLAPDDLGLLLQFEGKPPSHLTCSEEKEIRLKNASGLRRAFDGITHSGKHFRWVIAFLMHEITLYRIDILSTTEEALSITASKLALELPPEKGEWKEYSSQHVRYSAEENLAVSMPKNPFGLGGLPRENAVRASFQGSPLQLTDSVESVIGWARGPGITSINRTALLGIHG